MRHKLRGGGEEVNEIDEELFAVHKLGNRNFSKVVMKMITHDQHWCPWNLIEHYWKAVWQFVTNFHIFGPISGILFLNSKT